MNELGVWLTFVAIILVLGAILESIFILVFAALRTISRRENSVYYFTLKNRKVTQMVTGEKEKMLVHQQCNSFGSAFGKYVNYYFKNWWRWWMLDPIFFF